MARAKAVEGGVYSLPRFSSTEWFVLITRSNGKGVLVGYFYPAGSKIVNGKPSLVRQVTDSGIRNGEWNLVERLPSWKRDGWPLPSFRRLAPGESPSGETRVVTYDDDMAGVGQVRVVSGSCLELPLDGLSGHKAIEVHLKRLEQLAKIEG
jgi:hypothetical protein